jgi:hypothetical protein
MSVSASIPATVHIRRSRLAGLIAAVAALTAAVTWSVLALAFDGESGGSTSAAPTSEVTVSSAAADARRIPSIMALTPARLAAGALGTGYALPGTQHGPTTASVLAAP